MKKKRKITRLKSGFTIIELLIVITIMGILVGVAVPYYNDYISDSRASVLKQNLATMRNVINQFRGDRNRGPFVVEIHDGAVPKHFPWSSNITTGSELVAGTFLHDAATYKRQSNIKYLAALPEFPDPQTGGNIIGTIAPAPPPPNSDFTVCFVNLNGNTATSYVGPAFDIDAEFSFFDENRNEQYNTGEQVYFDLAGLGAPADGTAAEKLDYIDFNVTGSDGTVY